VIFPAFRGGWSLPGLRYTAGLPKGIYTMKKELHPKWYPDCKVNFRGQHVMTVGATVPELNVEIWSGSHPFYTGQKTFVDTLGRVERFQKKFAGEYFKKDAKGAKPAASDKK
jgi:large subunit ribosomal protein L31